MGLTASIERYLFPAFVIGWGVKSGMDFNDMLTHLFYLMRILLGMLLAG
jgi:hypothetical protein